MLIACLLASTVLLSSFLHGVQPSPALELDLANVTYTLGSCCKAGLLPFYFFHVAIHGTLTQLRPKILLSPLCYFEGPRNKYLLAAHRLFKTYAAGWKNNKKNNSRSASFFLSSDLCSWVEEQEEKQQQVEHTCWKLVALQGLLTETEPTQGQSAKSSS